MNTLAEDRDEMTTDAGRRWVQRMRRRYGIAATKPASWAAVKEQGLTEDEGGDVDDAIVALGYSPADVLTDAECMASNAAHRDGLGRWTLEVFGDGVSTPLVMYVRPYEDDEAQD